MQFYFPCQGHGATIEGKGGGAAQDEDDDNETAADADTDMDHNHIDTTWINDVMGHLHLFLSAKSVLATRAEEVRHIMILIAKYHVKAAAILISIWSPAYERPKTGLKHQIR